MSDFSMPGFERVISTKWDKILEAIYFAQEISKHVLVFCSSIEQATALQQEFDGSAIVTSETGKKAREGLILAFREGRVQTVFNVGVLTTGFDFPELDGIVLIRPTKSIGLYYQMAGRGVRKAEGKRSCKIIDLSGTVKKLGRIETIKMVKREMWELESETCSNWHNRLLYSYKCETNKTNKGILL